MDEYQGFKGNFGEGRKEPFYLVLESSNKTQFKDILGILILANDLCKALTENKTQLNMSSTHSIEEKIESEPFDIHTGTPWSNEKTTYVAKDIPNNLKREDVFKAIELYSKTKNYAKLIKKDIEKKYPKQIWDDELPSQGVIQIVYNDNLEKLVYRN